MLTTLTVKRIDPSLTREAWERLALEIYMGVYDGQMSRIMKVLKRINKPEYQALLNQQWYIEPTLVKSAAQKHYDDIALSGGVAGLEDWDLTADYDDVQENIFRLSRARAGWFARKMTETSQRQTQVVIRDWLETEGSTVSQLNDMVSRVWTGPRPAAAATTETTFMFSESRFVSWEASGVWGYGVNTMNDDRVRDTHKDAAKNGPYPLSDRDHRPPVYGDVGCRCTAYPVREAPSG